ncbi:MAG: response regulator [Pseudomonas sp.]|uniref:hybrid sensor histidine kinase/response regulator n=1 Tax=Pseudomonas abieticivorans TaxID=2931382 RepID=UPI0020BF97FC|nr:hybrid sensor histidine kinase/response regulator [Pseudomonas sp. PIA16]MDE1166502.1 response regulator [Pseudomonas sp.]
MVEDSQRDAELALFSLERDGFQIDSTLVYNHLGVEHALQNAVFDLILCDFLLPGSSGAQVFQSARQCSPQTPFIFLSGVYGEENAVEMMRLGATDYVLKQNLPLLPKAVRRALAEVDERRQRLRAEGSLQEAEVRARLATEAARMGVWEYWPLTGRLIWDERCRALYDLPLDTAVDLNYFFQHCHPLDRPDVEFKVAQTLTADDEQGYQAEYRVLLPTGVERWLATSGRTFFEDGQCVRFSGVVQDVTEQKQATEALQRLNELLGDRVEKRTRERDRTWELSRELLAVMRFDMTPIALNPAWEDTLGWSRETLVQMQLWELLHPQDIGATVRETENIAGGNVSTRFVNRMRHADGDYRWLSWTIVPDEGLMYAAVRDITSERAVVDELAATNQRLREQIAERERIEATLQQLQRLEAVGQLTAGVAHDFNNLLTVILSSATFLARDLARGKQDKVQSRLQNIQEAGERGAKLTGQLLSFSRRQRLEPMPVNLGDTVCGMLELLQRTLGGAIWVQTSTAADLWSALVDPTQTEMIILNLAINARDAMPSGGTLHLATYNEVVEQAPQRSEHPELGEYVVLSIGDSGTGMSESVLAKAFEPFFTTKDIGKGSGLGLAQVFGFAKQSGGGVSIETVPGEGTTVKVYLPSIRQAVAPVLLPGSERPDLGGQQRIVLLVDDDPEVREVTAALLDSLGYQVIEAQSAQEALNQVSTAVDLVLTDYAMPGMNGAELAQVLRTLQPQLPVVFMTGYADIDGLGEAEQVIVQKPFRGDELGLKLQQVLRSRERDSVREGL